MSGAVKSGLIFALVGAVGVVGFSFIPFVGALLCGPFAAALAGTAAGYFGVRWSAGVAGVGQGVLAGAISGVGTLIGAVIFWLVIFSFIQSVPGFQEQIQEAVRRQQPGTQVNQAQVEAIIKVVGPLLGVCFGVFNLLIALALGALGGWLATRNRAQTIATPPMPSPPMGPPPMAPPE
jgi:hypothetical protein